MDPRAAAGETHGTKLLNLLTITFTKWQSNADLLLVAKLPVRLQPAWCDVYSDCLCQVVIENNCSLMYACLINDGAVIKLVATSILFYFQ